MRPLTKAAKPQILVEREDEWTGVYVEAAEAGLDLGPFEKWRHKQIKERLAEEVEGKCAYCEAFVEDVSYPHVEHILPKAPFPQLAHVWINLTSACARCNTAKGDFYVQDDGLLDPYKDQLSDHVWFLGTLIQWTDGSIRGELTIRRLNLNRDDLTYSRARRLEKFREMFDRWRAADPPLKEALEDSIRLDAEKGEFSSHVTEYLRVLAFPI